MVVDPEDAQRRRNAPLRGDDSPVAVTAFQAQKIAAVMSAYMEGHTLFADAVLAGVDLLQWAALEAKGVPCARRPEQAWARLADVPWPSPGPPRTQPDLD